MWKIYIALSDYSEEALKILKRVFTNIQIRGAGERPSEDELCELVKEYEILIIGAKEKMTQKVYTNIQKLKILGTLSIGLDHIDKRFLVDNNIRVINCPDSNIISVAEHTFALILALCKKLFKSHQLTVSYIGRKGLDGLPFDLNNKTIGILGAGRIGSKVIHIAKAFNLNILCYTANPTKHTELLNLGVKYVNLKNLFSEADIISIHLPLTSNTNKLVSEELISLMKANSILINTSRTDIVNNIALSSALGKKLIFGAAIDLDIEDKNTIDLFRNLSNVILTPHTAGITIDSILRMDVDLSKNLVQMSL